MTSARRTIRRLVVSAALAIAGCGEPPEDPHGADPATARPSIVLISIDTLRSDRLPAYGYGGVETPAIDALARDAIRFERAWAPAPLTMPSHASILTGLLPAEHGVRDNIGYRLETDAVAYLPRLLEEAGYATGAAVSAVVLAGRLGFADGFDVYDDAIVERRRAGAGGRQRPGGETLAAILPWLRERGDDPFFLFVHLFEPHTPYEPSYDADVAAADRVVGELLEELRRVGVYDRSVVVLLSDHGEGLGDHGEDEHGVLLYREALQVPLLLKLPGSEHAGRSVAAPAALVDVFPTLLQLAGVPVPGRPGGAPGVEPPGGAPSVEPPGGAPGLQRLPGRSLLELLDGDPPPRALYAETFFPRLHFGWSELKSLVEGRWHYIHGPDPELYDLDADPGETRNLVRTDRGVAARLREALLAYDSALQAPGEVDAEERRALAALGYVGSAGDPTADGAGPLPDPKTRLATVADLKACLRHYAAGELEASAAACRRAVDANPRSLEAWEHLGRSLHELGRRAEALAALGRALELAAGRASHLGVASALILLEDRRPEDALELLDRELERSPETFELRLLEARTLAILGRLDEALASAEAAVRAAPGNADAVYMRGAVQLGRRAFADAERDLRRALELAGDHTAAMSDLAALRQQQGDVAEARALLQRVLELNPGDATAARNLRRLDAGPR